MSMNWLEATNGHADEPGRPQAMPVFAGQKLVVAGGSSGMGRQTAADVVAAGGSAVIIGDDPSKVDDTVQALAKDGQAYGITADLTDRSQVERVRRQLADEHADATLLLNAAGLFLPKPFLDYDGASYDSYARSGSTRSPRPSSPPRSTRGSSRPTRSTRPCTASTASTRSAASVPPATWLTPSPSCCPRLPAGSPAPSGTSTAA